MLMMEQEPSPYVHHRRRSIQVEAHIDFRQPNMCVDMQYTIESNEYSSILGKFLDSPYGREIDMRTACVLYYTGMPGFTTEDEVRYKGIVVKCKGTLVGLH